MHIVPVCVARFTARFGAGLVWDALAERNTFHTKGTLPKLSRWFSWNDSCEEQLPEFRGLKLCLGYHYQDSKLDPDLAEEQRGLASLVNESKKKCGDAQQIRREFSKLKECLGGGPKLAYYCMTEKLWFHCAIIQLCTRPIWTWYSNSVKHCKSPDDSLALAISLQSDWASDHHLRELARIPTSKDPMLVRPLAHEKILDAPVKVSELTFHLLRKRCSSFSKHSFPPECYAQVFSEDGLCREASVS